MRTTRPDLDTAAAVLALARDARAAADQAETDLLFAAVTWAEQHPPESIAVSATWPGTEGELALAGAGAPRVAEFCIAEFAAAIGRSTDSGRVLLAHALELKYRLPRTQARVERAGQPDGLAGGVAPWRARRIADATLRLTPEAAAFVDAQVAPFAHRIGPAQLDRLVAAAVARFMPEQAAEDARHAAERRHVTFHHDQLSFDGTTFVQAELDLADALDLDAAIGAGAEQLRLAGCTESLDARRAIAAGELAHHQLALDPDTHTDTDTDTDTQDDRDADSQDDRAEGPRGRRAPQRARQVVLYVHLAEAAITGGSGGLGLARVENHHRGVTAEQVKTWCANPEASVVVKPVIALAEHIHVDAYEIPDRLRDQADQRDSTCVFPWCTRPARRCATTSSPTPRAAAPARATPHPCADDITASRPTHRGATPWSNPAPTCRPARTTTSSSATTTAPSTSPATGVHLDRPTHPTSDHPAPDPAAPQPGGGTGMPRQLSTSRPGTQMSRAGAR